MVYDPKSVQEAYDTAALREDQAEKESSLRTELPRAFIMKYLKSEDVVLDAGGGTGINAIMMAERCAKVTLIDISPKVLEFAVKNVAEANLENKIEITEGDISDLRQFEDDQFTFAVCVGDSISYVLDKRFHAISELVRVVKPGSILVIGCDSKYGFLGLHLRQGNIDEAVEILRTSECYCGMGPRTHLYTVDEMTLLLEGAGCEILEIASTPTFTEAMDRDAFLGELDERELVQKWKKLKALELELCTVPELLGTGNHLLFVVRKG